MNDYHDQEIIDSIESGEWKSVSNFEDMKRDLMVAASETALKDYRISGPTLMNTSVSKDCWPGDGAAKASHRLIAG